MGTARALTVTRRKAGRTNVSGLRDSGYLQRVYARAVAVLDLGGRANPACMPSMHGEAHTLAPVVLPTRD